MFKHMIAATAIACAALGAMAAPGEAKTRVTIGLGTGFGDGYYDGCRFRDAWGRCMGPDRYVDDPYFGEPDYGRDNYYDEPVRRYSGSVNCDEAVDMVRERGFRRVQAMSCGGKYHRITGIKRGQRFMIKIHRQSGQVRTIQPY